MDNNSLLGSHDAHPDDSSSSSSDLQIELHDNLNNYSAENGGLSDDESIDADEEEGTVNLRGPPCQASAIPSMPSSQANSNSLVRDVKASALGRQMIHLADDKKALC